MRASTLTYALLLTFLPISLAYAEMNMDDMQKADALAKVVGSAGDCGYAIDDAKLEAYYAESGLDDPEIFSHITNLLAVQKLRDKPSKSECTMARLTAKKIGVLAP